MQKEKKQKSDCGANVPGGGGFQEDNTCATGYPAGQRPQDQAKSQPKTESIQPDRGSYKPNGQIPSKEEWESADQYFESFEKDNDYLNAIKDQPYERGGFFDDDGNMIGEKTEYLPDQINFQGMYIPERTTFIHNHPRGTSLSGADISFAVKHNLKRMVAAGPDGAYELTLPEGIQDKMIEYLGEAAAAEGGWPAAEINGEDIPINEALSRGLVSKKEVADYAIKMDLHRADQVVRKHYEKKIQEATDKQAVVDEANQNHTHMVNSVLAGAVWKKLGMTYRKIGKKK